MSALSQEQRNKLGPLISVGKLSILLFLSALLKSHLNDSKEEQGRVECIGGHHQAKDFHASLEARKWVELD